MPYARSGDYSCYNAPVWARVLSLFAGAALLAATACSDDGDPAASPTPPFNAQAEPTVVGTSVVFTAKGYELELPTGWIPDWNFVRTSEVPLDVLFAPDTVDGVQASVLIECGMPMPPSLDVFAANRTETIRELDRAEPLRADSTMLSGERAITLVWETTRGAVTTGRREILAVQGGCGWSLSLTLPPSARLQYEATFSALLASFRFLEP